MQRDIKSATYPSFPHIRDLIFLMQMHADIALQQCHIHGGMFIRRGLRPFGVRQMTCSRNIVHFAVIRNYTASLNDYTQLQSPT